MNFVNNIKQRYTTKQYDPNGKISDEEIAELKEILQYAPSSINSQPWHFTFVRSKEAKEKLAEVSLFNKSKIERCDTVVVFGVADDLELFEKEISKRLQNTALLFFSNVVKNQPEAETRKWLACQVYIALGVLLSACADMGIDSTPMEGIDTRGYDRVIGTQGYRTLFAVALGKRHHEDPNDPVRTPKQRRPIDDVVSEL